MAFILALRVAPTMKDTIKKGKHRQAMTVSVLVELQCEGVCEAEPSFSLL